MKYQTIFLDRVRKPKRSSEPVWVATLRSGRIIAQDTELVDCKNAARFYVEDVLKLRFGGFMRYA